MVFNSCNYVLWLDDGDEGGDYYEAFVILHKGEAEAGWWVSGAL